MQICTQIYLIQGSRVCLPLKKRGFGVGWHNGYGGKVKAGETLEESAARELVEESLVKALSLEKRGTLLFNFLQTGKKIKSHIFLCESFVGSPAETEEMVPYWFDFDKVPYKKMWPDDILWFPEFLKGHFFSGEFEFLDSIPTIGKHSVQIIK